MEKPECPRCGCEMECPECDAKESESGEAEEAGEIELKLPEEKPIKTSWFGKRFNKE